MKTYLSIILIITAFIAGFCMHTCSYFTPPVNPIHISNIDTNVIPTHEIDSIPKDSSVIKIVLRDSLIINDSLVLRYETISTYDTIKVYRDYFKKRYYDFSIDTLGIVFKMKEVVWANEIQKRSYTLDINKNSPKRFAVGALVGGNTGKFDVVPVLQYNKDKVIIQGQYHVFEKAIYGGVLYKF